jgi:hypothetical protein
VSDSFSDTAIHAGTDKIIRDKQIKDRLKEWGCTKNIKLSLAQLQYLCSELERREGKKSAVRIGGRRLSLKELEKVIRTIRRRHQQKTLSMLRVFPSYRNEANRDS